VSWPSLQWPRRSRTNLVSPGQAVNFDVLELQTAKEILAEIFRARPEDYRGYDSKATGGEDLA